MTAPQNVVARPDGTGTPVERVRVFSAIAFSRDRKFQN
jgi:hypothetical protein